MKYNKNNSYRYQPKINVRLRNRINNEIVVGDLINEEFIDGKAYYVMRVARGVIKLAKEAFTVTH